MSKSATWLLDHRRDVHSQTGEDGIVEKILATIGDNDRWCVEFGAWDGQFLTNTRHLIESSDYSAVLIEADRGRFADLQRNYAGRANVTTLGRFVGFGAEDNLDVILAATPIPRDFDFLSIDIDGNDFHVWKAMAIYRPKVVVIEFNPTIPPPLRFVQPADPALNQGCSLDALVELGKQKGYELVSAVLFNAFFVRAEYLPLFELESNSPAALRTDLAAVTWLFTGFDGTLFLRGSCHMPWHGLALKESRFQRLPRFLRHFPGNYSRLQKVVFGLLVLFTEPAKFLPRRQKPEPR